MFIHAASAFDMTSSNKPWTEHWSMAMKSIYYWICYGRTEGSSLLTPKPASKHNPHSTSSIHILFPNIQLNVNLAFLDPASEHVPWFPHHKHNCEPRFYSRPYAKRESGFARACFNLWSSQENSLIQNLFPKHFLFPPIPVVVWCSIWL